MPRYQAFQMLQQQLKMDSNWTIIFIIATILEAEFSFMPVTDYISK